ncbi:hypothetical protein LWM68_21230 [Niabella sp. W65]|nr:hypothetical protein [Niabella sp. W65]MCH7365054.1 hypothetical protein [Niabella sp. W65]
MEVKTTVRVTNDFNYNFMHLSFNIEKFIGENITQRSESLFAADLKAFENDLKKK